MPLISSNSIFKEESLRGLFGEFTWTETRKTWKLKKRCLGLGYCTIKIEKEKMNDVLNLIKNYTFEDDLSLYNKKRANIEDTYEHIVKIEYKHPSLSLDHLKTESLDISISSMSDKYSLFLYMKNSLDSLSLDALANLEFKLNEYQNKTLDFWEIIRILNEEIFDVKSIKITSKEILSHSDMKRLANAYLFKCAYRFNAIVSVKNIFREYHSLFPNERFRYNDATISSLHINDEILILYQQAIKFKDPFESYLSFYHIIEYYFQEIGEEFKKDIKIPTQFQGSNEDFNKILSKCFNEEIRLELILRKYVNQAWFKKELEFFDPEYYNYLENNEVEFANARIINDSKFHYSLAKRIYRIRNALVHRKEGSNEYKYRPTIKEHKDILRKELLLMKLIVNRIIINKGGTIEYY